MDEVDGTGFIVSRQGYLLTNNHVIEKGADIEQMQITGAIGSKNGQKTPILPITRDEEHDLALLQLENSAETYQPVLIGEPWTVSEGAVLCSIGFPLDSEFHYSEGRLGGKAAKNGWWSSQIPSNRGESGAPVFSDQTGKVVAIKVAGYDDAQNLNLIIPINLARHILVDVPDLPVLPSGKQSNNAPSVNLPGGSRTLYNGFQFGGQSAFNFASGQILGWGSQEADLGVANPDPKAPAMFFLPNDSPPYTDPNARSHGIENAGIKDMAASNLDDVTECPVSDYHVHYFNPQLDRVYCLRTRDGSHYAKIKVTVMAPDRISFDYVYQPGSSRTFH